MINSSSSSRTQRRRRRSMGHSGNGRPPRQRSRRLVPPMRVRLIPPRGCHHKAPPQPCALTTIAHSTNKHQRVASAKCGRRASPSSPSAPGRCIGPPALGVRRGPFEDLRTKRNLATATRTTGRRARSRGARCYRGLAVALRREAARVRDRGGLVGADADGVRRAARRDHAARDRAHDRRRNEHDDTLHLLLEVGFVRVRAHPIDAVPQRRARGRPERAQVVQHRERLVPRGGVSRKECPSLTNMSNCRAWAAQRTARA